jgi:hypothetical protein
MQNWNEVDFDAVIGDELSLDGTLDSLNREYGMNFKLGSVLKSIEQDLIAEKTRNNFSVAAPDGKWIPCTLTDDQMEQVSGGGDWVAVNVYVVVNTGVAVNAAVVVNAAVGVGAVAAVVAAVVVVVLVAGADTPVVVVPD